LAGSVSLASVNEAGQHSDRFRNTFPLARRRRAARRAVEGLSDQGDSRGQDQGGEARARV